ncbi:nucleoid-associated protein [Candidatus Sororendozoicomonas aggregata]|uniref:nucleoid-associated protein n=1 Tax=Candidatus Sororendozoicomonas aggregata TaxID=3073239 RepID=UPI002ED01406
MSVSFTNFNLNRIILHNVYAPNGKERTEPGISKELIALDDKALGKLEERLTAVLGRGSHCMEMEIANISESGCFAKACKIMHTSDSDFIRFSEAFAHKHTEAHTSTRWPGGALVILDGTVGVSPERHCLIIIKAERQEGFKQEKNTMEYLENLLLTPQTKLYKVGVFVELADGASRADDVDVGQFSVFIFDRNMIGGDERRAAKYFYDDFLGLRTPYKAEHQTREFFELTTKFIDESELDQRQKFDLHNALYTYLKTDQSNVVEVSGFAKHYLQAGTRDDYERYMRKEGFSNSAVLKDTSLLGKKLKIRRMQFSSDVTVAAPTDKFQSSIKVIETTLEGTTVYIEGKMLEQK